MNNGGFEMIDTLITGGTTPLVFQGSLFASAAPPLVAWDERSHLQAPGAEPGPPPAGGRQRKGPPFSEN